MRTRHKCHKCGKKKEQKYMDQLPAGKWSCKNCQDENRRYGRRQHSWRSTKVDQYGPTKQLI